jgi:hypothetical protein
VGICSGWRLAAASVGWLKDFDAPALAPAVLQSVLDTMPIMDAVILRNRSRMSEDIPTTSACDVERPYVHWLRAASNVLRITEISHPLPVTPAHWLQPIVEWMAGLIQNSEVMEGLDALDLRVLAAACTSMLVHRMHRQDVTREPGEQDLIEDMSAEAAMFVQAVLSRAKGQGMDVETASHRCKLQGDGAICLAAMLVSAGGFSVNNANWHKSCVSASALQAVCLGIECLLNSTEDAREQDIAVWAVSKVMHELRYCVIGSDATLTDLAVAYAAVLRFLAYRSHYPAITGTEISKGLQLLMDRGSWKNDTACRSPTDADYAAGLSLAVSFRKLVLSMGDANRMGNATMKVDPHVFLMLAGCMSRVINKITGQMTAGAHVPTALQEEQ